MINPQNVVDILGNLISERLTISSTSKKGPKDEAIASLLFNNVQALLNCTSYSFEDKDSLDLDLDIESVDDKYSTDTNDYFTDNDDKSDDEFNVDNEPHDTDYDNKWEREAIRDQFSLEYMRNVAQFYNEKDPNTEKRKHSFSGVQRRFKKVKHRNYIHRFRKYIEAQGTKKEKLNHIDSFVYESFKNSRQQLLSIHDIDLKRWALKKAAELGDLTFVAGDR